MGHFTIVSNDGYQFYFWCQAGDVATTDNAFDTRAEAEAAGQAHEEALNR